MKDDCSLARALELDAKKATTVTRKAVESETAIAAKPKSKPKRSSKIKELDEPNAKRASPTAQETADQESVIASLKPRSKVKPSKPCKPSESIKSEKFTISLSSTSTITDFESITTSDDALVVSSIPMPASKRSKMTSIQFEKLNTKKEAFDAKKAAVTAQKAKKQETANAAVTAIETTKPEACVKNIDFFDPTMLLNLSEFCISAFSASFLHHLTEIAANYQEKSIIKILSQCLRGPALT